MEIDEVISYLDGYIQMHGGIYSRWYVGVTSNVDQRLFEQHKLTKLDLCTWKYTSSDTIARLIEKYFLSLGCDGNPGGGDEKSTIVYVYKKAPHTNP